MTFEITINFQQAVIFLQVQKTDENTFIIRRQKVMYDDEQSDFPRQQEVKNEGGHWQYEARLQSYTKAIIPALEHYLMQQKGRDSSFIRTQPK